MKEREEINEEYKSLEEKFNEQNKKETSSQNKNARKPLVIAFGSIIVIIVLYYGIGEFTKYLKIKELQAESDYLQSVIDSGDYSSFDTSVNVLNDLSLSNFSARSDGTYVNVYGSITNTSSQNIDEIISIALFDDNGGIVSVEPLIVKINAGETMHFEELVGLVRDGTPIPSRAELTD